MNRTLHFDPVRHRFIEALAQRAAAHKGEVRRILDARLETLRADYERDREAAGCAPADAARLRVVPGPGPLAQLVAPHARGVVGGAPPELKALSHFRSTWSRLSTDRRLIESQARVPEKPGPLNSNHLLHRSLTLMRELSPEYLQRFMAYADTLLWIDRATGGELPRAETAKRTPAAAPVPAAPVKTRRARARR